MVSNPNSPWRKTRRIDDKDYLKSINLLASHGSQLKSHEQVFLENLLEDVKKATENGHSLSSGVRNFRCRYARVLSLLKKLEVSPW